MVYLCYEFAVQGRRFTVVLKGSIRLRVDNGVFVLL
jgi:hypothetical protein